MKNAVVVGATTQVGFALCQELMNHEVEVTGFEWSERMDERADEMLMGIGRNAFFHLQLDQPLEETVDVAFFFIDRMEELDQANRETCISYTEKAKKLVLISSYHNYRKNIDFTNMLRKKRKDGTKCLSIYLPMVVGPWQGEKEAVHRRLQEEMDEKERQPIAIHDTDVLYVEDVVKAIYELTNTEGPERVVRFKNENPEALKELMEVLHLTLLEDGNHDEWYKVTEYKVRQSLTIKDSLQAQRKQMQQKLKID